MDTDEEEVYEAHYWTNRLAKQAATDLLFYGRVNSGNMDAILSMSPEQQTETLTLALSYGSQLQKIQGNIQLEVDASLNLAARIEDSALSVPLKLEAKEDKITIDKEENILNVYNT
jgi:hypothetical protein